MSCRTMLSLAVLLVGCSGAQAPTEPVPPTPGDSPAAAESKEAAEPSTAEPEAGQEAAKAEPACRPSATDDVPPTTEAPCPPETCLESKPGLLATCIDSKHKGCTHYLLARVTADGTTEPLNVYIRCPGDSATAIKGTLMKSYAETGVPALPAEAKPPEKACTHIAVHDCPGE